VNCNLADFIFFCVLGVPFQDIFIVFRIAAAAQARTTHGCYRFRAQRMPSSHGQIRVEHSRLNRNCGRQVSLAWKMLYLFLISVRSSMFEAGVDREFSGMELIT
jgi:hypothetical protein